MVKLQKQKSILFTRYEYLKKISTMLMVDLITVALIVFAAGFLLGIIISELL